MPSDNCHLLWPNPERVREFRHDRGWSQDTLARKARCDKKTIENIESRKVRKQCHRVILERVAKELGTSLEEITAPPPPPDTRRVRRPALPENGQEVGRGDTHLRCSPAAEAETAGMPSAAGKPLLQEDGLSGSSSALLRTDDLAALEDFVSRAVESSHRALIDRALELIHRQVHADTCGFQDLDDEDTIFKVVYPVQARVDVRLSRQLTQRALREGQRVWLSASQGGESLVFRDALCIPLRADKPGAGPDDRVLPLGALHVYRAYRLFSEREVHFCEALAGYLAKTLDAQRARRTPEADNSRLRVASPASGDELIGDSPAMVQLRERISRLADGPSTLLIGGESGVGKELVAQGLHRRSRRAGGPLVTVNCAAITASMPESELFGHVKEAFTGAVSFHDGFFLRADGGTLLLDEICELSLEVQAMLLRVLETGKFRPVGGNVEVKANVRIIATTRYNLQRPVGLGAFRQDLYFRLGQLLRVPPLREHLEDVPALVHHFLGQLCLEAKRRVTLTEAALNRLQTYRWWPGNVRHLRLVLATAVFLNMTGTIHATDLHLVDELNVPKGEGPASLNLEELEIWAIRRALGQTGGNNARAAKLLGIDHDALSAKLKKYQTDPSGHGGST